MRRPQFSTRGLLAVVAFSAVCLSLLRAIHDPFLGLVVLVAGSVAGLAIIRTASELARRRVEGVTTDAREVASILISSMVIAVTIIGLSDLAFLVAYHVVDYVGPSHPHHVPSGFCLPSAAVGLVSAILVASRLKHVIWAYGSYRRAPGREWVRLWPVAFLAVMGLTMVAAELRERFLYCRERADYHAGPEARGDGPGEAEVHAWYKRYYERAAYRPWLPIRPAPAVYGVPGSRRSRKWLQSPSEDRTSGSVRAE
jgi:hypothetical protein